MPEAEERFARVCQFFNAGLALRPQGLRELADQSPSAFLNLSRMLLNDCRDTAGVRQVLSMLASRGWLAPMIRDVARADPGLAGGISHLGMSVYPALERELSSPEPPPAAVGDPAFAQDLIAAIEVALSLLPAPTSVVKPLDARSRATLARLYSKLAVAQDYLSQLLRDPEPRVRANAVEALWHMPVEHTLERLLEAARDPHHRVAANGLVGLSLAGDERALSGLVDMAEQGEGLARLAAIWAMGRTGDARCTPFLKQWRTRHRNDTEALRGSLAALVRLRQAEALCTSRPADLAVLSARTSGERFVVEALVRCPDGEKPDAGGGHVQPWLGEQPVWKYQAVFEPVSSLARVLCLLPSGASKEEVERRWAAVKGECPAEVSFGDGAGAAAWTHVVLLGEGARLNDERAHMAQSARVYSLTGQRAQDSAGMVEALAAVLRGVWVIRLPDPGRDTVASLTLRLRSPGWAAGPVSAAPAADL